MRVAGLPSIQTRGRGCAVARKAIEVAKDIVAEYENPVARPDTGCSDQMIGRRCWRLIRISDA